jgi:hypothetical protein
MVFRSQNILKKLRNNYSSLFIQILLLEEIITYLNTYFEYILWNIQLN